jgi:hypothetical protein
MDHRIEITPLNRNLFRVFYGELELKPSRVPMCDVARYLLAKGLAQPEDRLITTLRTVHSMSGQIGWLAEHTVKEDDDHGPRFVKWRPFPGARVPSETANSDPPGT